MAVYVVAQLDVKNTNWQHEYGPQARAILQKHGGKVIVGPGYTMNASKEGITKCHVYSEFPSVEQASVVPRSCVWGVDWLAPVRSGCGNCPRDGFAPSIMMETYACVSRWRRVKNSLSIYCHVLPFVTSSRYPPSSDNHGLPLPWQ